MATAKQLKAAILAKRASKGARRKRTRPEPRQYTVADLERARDRVEAAERRIDNDRTNNPNRGRAGLERAQLELSRNYACAASLSDGSIELSRYPGDHVEGSAVIARPSVVGYATGSGPPETCCSPQLRAIRRHRTGCQDGTSPAANLARPTARTAASFSSTCAADLQATWATRV